MDLASGVLTFEAAQVAGRDPNQSILFFGSHTGIFEYGCPAEFEAGQYLADCWRAWNRSEKWAGYESQAGILRTVSFPDISGRPNPSLAEAEVDCITAADGNPFPKNTVSNGGWGITSSSCCRFIRLAFMLSKGNRLWPRFP